MYLSSQYSISINESDEEEVGLLTSQRSGSFFKLNDVPTYGLYNRNDYMQRCYKRCRKLNDKNGEQLKKLLCFGGESSKSGDCCSSLFFTMVFILPLLSLVLLVPNKGLSTCSRVVFVSTCLALLVLLTIWHAYSIFVIVNNKKKWLKSWFTVEVSNAMIPPPATPVGTGGRGDRFFDIRYNMRYYDITKESIPNSPLLDMEKKKELLHVFSSRNIGKARLILYKKRFMHSVSLVPRNFAMFLLVVTFICLCITTFELLSLLHVFPEI